MGFVRMVTATCDGPLHTGKEHACQGSGWTRPEAIQQAKMHGWKWRGQKIMCPECTTAHDADCKAKKEVPA